jgi:hypothetical protein
MPTSPAGDSNWANSASTASTPERTAVAAARPRSVSSIVLRPRSSGLSWRSTYPRTTRVSISCLAACLVIPTFVSGRPPIRRGWPFPPTRTAVSGSVLESRIREAGADGLGVGASCRPARCGNHDLIGIGWRRHAREVPCGVPVVKGIDSQGSCRLRTGRRSP